MFSSPSGDIRDPLRALIDTTRVQRGWSRRKLAKRSGLPESTIYSLFDPHRAHYGVSFTTLERISGALDIPLGTLFLYKLRHDHQHHHETAVQLLLDIWSKLSLADRAALMALAVELHNATVGSTTE
jgi:transcriptional regulator with XRE-family HTH domain